MKTIKKYETFSIKEELLNNDSLINRICESYPKHIKSLEELLNFIEKDFNIHPSISKGLLERIINSKI
jgi:hypothetical protein